MSKNSLIRTIGDISSLSNNSYGLPSTSNFTMGDAFIKNPKTIFQFPVGKNNNGAVDNLPAICKNLGEGDMNVVYVVPKENVASFKPEFIDEKFKITQYVTTLPIPANVEALEGIAKVKRRGKETSDEESFGQLLRGRKGKRKLETCSYAFKLLLVKMRMMLIGEVRRGNYGGVNDNAEGQAGELNKQ